MANLSFVELMALRSAQQVQLGAIYEEAFPPSQRVPFDGLVAGARLGTQLIVVATDAADPVAFAALSRLKSAGCVFVEYFAVTPHRRGRGIGSMLWGHIVRSLEEREEPLRLVLEVEDPDERGIGADDVKVRHRRIRFWERRGAMLLPDHGYRIPDLDGGSGSEPMRLMWAGTATVPAVAPTGEELRRVMLALYAEGYDLPHDHPLVVRARQLPLSPPEAPSSDGSPPATLPPGSSLTAPGIAGAAWAPSAP